MCVSHVGGLVSSEGVRLGASGEPLLKLVKALVFNWAGNICGGGGDSVGRGGG